MINELDKMISQNKNEKYSSNYIFSTCTSDALLPMWSLYAKDSGVCIVFDKHKLDANLIATCSSEIQPLSYGNNPLNNYKCLYEKKNKERNNQENCQICL